MVAQVEFAAYGAEGGRTLKNASRGKLAAFVTVSAVFGFVLPGLIFSGQKSSDFTCTPGSENSAWCETDRLDVAVSEAVVVAPRAVGLLSHAFTLGASPIVGIGSMVSLRGPGTLAEDMAVYTGTQFVSVGLNSIAKRFFRRQRPCYHFGRENETEAIIFAGQEWVSFYSGDSAMAFSLYSAALALIVARGWRAPAVKLSKIGAVVASIGSFLRIVGFMHWFTDVVVGVVVGLVIGFGLPTVLFAEAPKDALARAAGFYPAHSDSQASAALLSVTGIDP
jgi:membrane-associated phospholipid phosphatase|eukprot:COSAG02_NODE_208_length_29027_cov_27.870230_16_plen_279_part_00